MRQYGFIGNVRRVGVVVAASTWTIIAGSNTSAADANGATTPSIDTTGAKILVIAISSYVVNPAPTVSDSKSNTWIPLTEHSFTGDGRNQIFYAVNPTVGTGHTFSFSGTGSFSAMCVAGFTTLLTGTISADQENGNSGATLTSIQPGSVTPGVSGELLICGFNNSGTFSNLAIDNGFTITDSVNYVNATNYGCALGYISQEAAAAINPTWSWTTTSVTSVCGIATFKITGAFAQTLNSSITAVSAVVKISGKTLVGNVTVSSAVVKITSKIVSGSVTCGSGLVKIVIKVLNGTVIVSSGVVKRVSVVLSGSVTVVSVTVKVGRKVLSGSVTAATALATAATKSVTLNSSITVVSSVVKRVGKSLSGSVTALSSVVKVARKVVGSSVTAVSGVTVRLVRQVTLSSSVIVVSSVVTQFISGSGVVLNNAWSMFRRRRR